MNVICIADGRAFESHGRALSFVFALKGNEKKKQKKSRLSKRLISFHITRLAFPLLRPTDGLKKKIGVALPDKRKRDGSNIGDQGRAFKNVRETGRWRIFVFDKKNSL